MRYDIILYASVALVLALGAVVCIYSLDQAGSGFLARCF